METLKSLSRGAATRPCLPSPLGAVGVIGRHNNTGVGKRLAVEVRNAICLTSHSSLIHSSNDDTWIDRSFAARQERWIDCTRQLSQWSVLVDFSSTLQYPELMMESAWKARSWDVSPCGVDLLAYESRSFFSRSVLVEYLHDLLRFIKEDRTI